MEHWHGNLTSPSQAGTMNITTTYGSTTITQNLTPTGVINNTAWNQLSGCGSSISIVAQCSGEANRYNDWVYYDFAPAACNVQVSIRLNAGNTVVLTEACSNLYPVTISGTFYDNAPPVISCNNITVQGCDSAVVSNYNVSVNDACDANPTVTYSIAPGSKFPQGTTQVTVTATDNGNRSSTCTFNVTVVDNQNPVARCQNASVSIGNNGTASVSASDIDDGSSDNCGIASMSVYPNSWSCSETGYHDVLLTVTDINNNTSTCSAVVQVSDDTDPVASCKNATVTLSNGTASISASDVDGGSYDGCGILSLEIDNSTYDCDDIGTHDVTLTVTDNNNNVSTCTAVVTVAGAVPTCSLSATPSDNTYTGGVSTNIYIGYGPQSATVTANASGGSSFSYAWSGSDISGSGSSVTFSPSAAGNYTITCTVTNDNGCQTTCSITFCVKDIQAGGSGKNKKVYLCHVPPGNTSNPQTLSVSINAIASHLSNHSGDALGACTQSCGSSKKQFDASEVAVFGDNMNIMVYPNPSKGAFNLEVETDVDDIITVEIMDLTGKKMGMELTAMPHEIIKIGENLAPGFYLARIVQGSKVETIRLTKN